MVIRWGNNGRFESDEKNPVENGKYGSWRREKNAEEWQKVDETECLNAWIQFLPRAQTVNPQ